MREAKIIFSLLCLILVISAPSAAQESEYKAYNQVSVRAGVGTEYFGRNIQADTQEFQLKGLLFTLNGRFEFQKGFSAGIKLGYGLGNYDGMYFRDLPISIELGVGNIAGFLFGADVEKRIYDYNYFSFSLFGDFLYYLGKSNVWDIPGLSVDGTVEGKPSWYRIWIGPEISYQAWENFYPYLRIGYNNLSGKFEMNQSIQSLSGSEEKKYSGDLDVSLTLGAVFHITRFLMVKGDATVIPYDDWQNFNLGFALKILYLL